MNLVTGATGLVGSYLCRYLIKKEQNIIALKRKGSDTGILSDLNSKIEWVEGDLNDVELLEDLCKKANKIYHCAARVSYHPKDKNEMFNTNINGTANLLNAAINNDVEKFLFFSSIAALGGLKGTIKDEESEWDEAKDHTQYARSKYFAEKEVWRAMAEGLNCIIINPSVIIGAGYWHRSSLQLFESVFNGLKYFTNGKTGYVDVRDVCKIAMQLMESDKINQRYIISENNYSYQYIFKTIAKHLQVKAPHILVTKFKAQLAWRIEKLKSLFFSSQPLITKETAKMIFHNNEYSTDKIKKTLNYQFIPIEKSLEESCNAFLNSKANNASFGLLDF